ncbi:MAG TPA: hypothetical protein VJ063_01760 [Verrucomicrobiae bacterium]|nr:hypothetical protein [Verrucomicrobiae bacterium]
MNDHAQITIQRDKRFVDSLRAFKIVVDQIVVAAVRVGQSVTVPIAAGQHTLQLRIDWCDSEELQIDAHAGEHLRFDCGNSLFGWRLIVSLFYVIFRSREYLWLRRADAA